MTVTLYVSDIKNVSTGTDCYVIYRGPQNIWTYINVSALHTL